MCGVHGVFGDRMVRRSCDVNCGDLAGIERVGFVAFGVEAMITTRQESEPP